MNGNTKSSSNFQILVVLRGLFEEVNLEVRYIVKNPVSKECQAYGVAKSGVSNV